MLAHPELWSQYYDARPTFVFTSRNLPCPAGADVRFRRGPVADHLPEIRTAGGPANVWAVGGGATSPGSSSTPAHSTRSC